MDHFSARAERVLHPKTILVSSIRTLSDHLNKTVLHEKYVIQGLSTNQIAADLGVCKTAVLASLTREGIPRRTRFQHHGRPATPPFGMKRFRDRLVKNQEEQEVIKLVLEWDRIEKISTTSIARRLKDRGFRTRPGHTNWHHETIRQILKRNKK